MFQSMEGSNLTLVLEYSVIISSLSFGKKIFHQNNNIPFDFETTKLEFQQDEHFHVKNKINEGNFWLLINSSSIFNETSNRKWAVHLLKPTSNNYFWITLNYMSFLYISPNISTDRIESQMRNMSRSLKAQLGSLDCNFIGCRKYSSHQPSIFEFSSRQENYVCWLYLKPMLTFQLTDEWLMTTFVGNFLHRETNSLRILAIQKFKKKCSWFFSSLQFSKLHYLHLARL